jgi:predicted TIM-barrel fold metal-dependent hydrolase
MRKDIVSADSHLVEPADLWTQRLDEKYKDKAPRVEKQGRSFFFVAPGLRPFPIATTYAAGKSGTELFESYKKGLETARPGGWDPAERIKDQDIDGVVAEVLYTSMGLPLLSMPDTELLNVCLQTYNGWVAEFISHNPARFCGVGLISLDDVGEAVKELRRCVKIGLQGVQIPAAPPSEKPYYLPFYNEFWAEAESLGIPVSLHAGTGKKEWDQSNTDLKTTGPEFMTYVSCAGHQVVQRVLSSLIYGAVLERFPRLTFVSTENDSGWVPHFIYRMDRMFERFGSGDKSVKLSLRPGEYMQRQVMITFQDDNVGPLNYKLFGTDNYMWASDYPHADSTWPHSKDVIEASFSTIPEEVEEKIVRDNVIRTYRMNLQ